MQPSQSAEHLPENKSSKMSSPEAKNGSQEVYDFLSRLNLERYYEQFIEEGFDQMRSLNEVTEADLIALGVKRGHRRLIQREIATLNNIPISTPLHMLSSSTTFHSFYHDLPPSISPQDLPVTPTTTASSRIPTYSPQQPSAQANLSETDSLAPMGSVSSAEELEFSSDTLLHKQAKRRYRRHAKPDPHAPIKPPSAYVMFANKVREELKGRILSFTEIAKIVGDRWKSLSPKEKEYYDMTASKAKEIYLNDLVKYETTQDYRNYQQYLADFKAKQEAAGSQACLRPGKRSKIKSNLSVEAGKEEKNLAANHKSLLPPFDKFNDQIASQSSQGQLKLPKLPPLPPPFHISRYPHTSESFTPATLDFSPQPLHPPPTSPGTLSSAVNSLSDDIDPSRYSPSVSKTSSQRLQQKRQGKKENYQDQGKG
ncbi:uncharacterized protein VTP21DRAFT_8198 [Calcarisporiella thermophila]|uniref:uncharacterized protein n=1 Tax=Calcarisporiella thermophila TaxID=911321 RepID=UPI0037426AEA